MWGSSFLFIEIGLEHLSPVVVAWARIALGAVALGCVPAARRPIVRRDWPAVAAVGLIWNGRTVRAVPAGAAVHRLLFGRHDQRGGTDSSRSPC